MSESSTSFICSPQFRNIADSETEKKKRNQRMSLIMFRRSTMFAKRYIASTMSTSSKPSEPTTTTSTISTPYPCPPNANDLAAMLKLHGRFPLQIEQLNINVMPQCMRSKFKCGVLPFFFFSSFSCNQCLLCQNQNHIQQRIDMLFCMKNMIMVKISFLTFQKKKKSKSSCFPASSRYSISLACICSFCTCFCNSSMVRNRDFSADFSPFCFVFFF